MSIKNLTQSILLATTALLASDFIQQAEARDTLVVKENPKYMKHNRPDVQFYDCQKCFVKSKGTLICTTYGTSVQWGWGWSQEWYDDPTTIDYKDGWYYLGYQLYSKQGGGASLLIDIEKALYQNLHLSVDSFQANVRLETKYYYTSKRTCVYGYYKHEDFLLQLELAMSLPQCYKNVVNCPWNLDNWRSKWALWLDLCEMSSSEDIDLIEKDYDSAASEKYFIGDGTDSSNCTPGWLWEGSPFGSYMGNLQNRMVHYFQLQMQKKGRRDFTPSTLFDIQTSSD